MRFILILVLLYVEAAHALPPSMWTEEQAKTICALDVRRLYGDTLAVVSFMGKQPHEDNTTLVGLVASDSRTEYKRQQVVVGCIYKQDGSLFTIFFNSKVANWIAPERAAAPAKRPAPQSASTPSTGGYPRNPANEQLMSYPEADRPLYLAMVIRNGGEQCTPSGAAYRGAHNDGSVFYHVSCLEGEDYMVMIQADEKGTASAVACSLMALTGTDCRNNL